MREDNINERLYRPLKLCTWIIIMTMVNNNNNNKLIYMAPQGRNFRGAGGNVMRSDVYATVES